MGRLHRALVAAGAAYLAELKEASKIEELDRRLATIEASTLAANANKARSRMAGLIEQRNAELSARAEAARARVLSIRNNEEAELQAKLAKLREKFNS